MLKSILVLAGIVALAPGGLLADQADRRATLGVVGVVGHWAEDAEGGTPVVRVDGRPGHAPPVAQVEKVSTSLFGRVDPEFVANATAPGAFSLAALSRPTSFSEGTYRAGFRLVSGASDQTAGLVFDLRPNGEYLYARYNTKDGNVALWRFANGKRAVIAHGEQHVQLPLGAWHELVVSITGTRMVATVNGKLRLEQTLARPVEGRVGFWTKRDSVTMFKDVRVTANAR